MRDVIRQKLADSVGSPLPGVTRREARVPPIPGKAHAVVGMRRSGKTSFLFQCMRERLDAGVPREALVYFSFEDERLAGMQAGDLAAVLEEYYLRFPEFRDKRRVTFLFDEIQVVPGWETFVRRMLDSEKVEIFVSGSSARMLSREVATTLRGRATETAIFPFGFRELLRHSGGEEPPRPGLLSKGVRSRLDHAFADSLEAGGFPEAQGLEARDRVALLQGYVETCIFRDVVERHGATNVVALRRLVRQLLGAPASPFSVAKFYNDLRSQGVAVSKDALHAMLAHLEDAFLVRLVPMETSSERQRQVNPRKAYPVDQGLVGAFDRSGKANLGHRLETAVAIELERRGCERAYVRTTDGHEVDFLSRAPQGETHLIQVAAELSEDGSAEREFRALAGAARAHPRARLLLLTASTGAAVAARRSAPKGVEVLPAWEWMLDEREPAR